ncbi:hypothetical protein, conserved [Plasmodium gonderi]|uniref:Uncharacterized protein n=1 Tax=Plasmodium gonderi TaxID=77519 RepID=A0A1Y1JR92_PLAGO|nr:hypothetical protein, conserved [Plasmodium gonderi]GAW83342.1 hypothetical protein, conserved [Plasmodium gonderi]
MVMNKEKICNEGNLKFLKVYSNTLFKYTEEEKDKKSSELLLLSEKIEDGKRLIKINIDIILIILFFIVLYASNDLVKIKNLENYIYNNVSESKTYSEHFYKSISEHIKKINNDFSYKPRKKDYILFKNLHTKFDLSSWLKNAFTEKISQENFLNSNIIIGKCWRVTMRLYKKDNSMLENIYNYRKIFEIYPDSSFLENFEDTRNINSSFFNKKWNYSYSREKSYKKIGGLYQIICEKDFNKIQEGLSQGSSYVTDYPYFIPALILTNYNIASVAIDFLLFNPLLNVLSYNVLKFSFLPNTKTYKEVVTQSASYNRFDIYFLIALSVFIITFIIYITIYVRKIALVGFKLYVKSYSTPFLLTVSFGSNLVTLCIYLLHQTLLPKISANYENGKFKVDTTHHLSSPEQITEFLHSMTIFFSRMELIKNIFVYNTIITFSVCCFVCIKRNGLLIKKYNIVENNIKRDFLFPFLIILSIIFGCLGIFSVFSYTLFHIDENIGSSIIYTFIFNVCIIFANFQGVNISSILNEENILSYFYSIPTHFFIVTISFAFLFFLSIKSFIKRDKKIYDLFIYQYGDRSLKRGNMHQGDEQSKNSKRGKLEAYDINTKNNDGEKAFEKEYSNERAKNDNSIIEITSYSGAEDEMVQKESHNVEDTYGSFDDDLIDNVKECDEEMLSIDNSSIYSLDESNEYEIDPNKYDKNKELNYNDIMNITKELHNDQEKNDTERQDKKMGNRKKNALFNIEKILDLFVNLKSSNIMPFSSREKRFISKEYNMNKKRNDGIIFSLSVYISFLMFIMLFLINDYKKGRESEELLKYQIESIGYFSNNALIENMKFHHLKKIINVNIKKENINFQKIENKTDLVQWLKSCFISLLGNNSNALGNASKNYSSTFQWNDIFSMKQEQVQINIVSRERIHSSNNSLICDYKQRNCYINLRNEAQILQNGINDVALLINDAIKKIEISYILFDKNDYHNVLVTLHFVFNSSGHISKNIYFDHLFFNSFNIFHFKGVVINILFITILLCSFVIMYLYMFKNFTYFYNACISLLMGNNKNVAECGLQNGQLSAWPIENMGNTNNPNNYNYGSYPFLDYNNIDEYMGAMNYGGYGNYSGAGLTNYGIYGNYPAFNMQGCGYNYGLDPNNFNIRGDYKNDKKYKIGTLLKLKVYLIYLFESDVLNLMILLSSFTLVALWLTVCIYINKIEYSTDNLGIYFNIYIKLFSFFRKFVNIFYFFLFLIIINIFIFSSNYIKKEKLYETLYINKKQILKCSFLFLFVFVNFFMFHYFFYGVDGFNDLTTSQQFIYSILTLLGLVHIDVYLKCNVFYFLFLVLPHLILIRLIFIYSLLAPILVSYLILIKKKKEKKKKKKIASKKGEDYSTFTLTHLSNEQWKYLNEEIKEFAEKETNNILLYFEVFKDQLRGNNDISKTLITECDHLKERIYGLQLDLRKIELQWKFRSKLLSSSRTYLEKINNQINMSEEIISEDKNRLHTLKQYAKQIIMDT